MANTKETVLAALMNYLKVNGFPNCKKDAQAPDAAIVLIAIQDARILIRLEANQNAYLYLYAAGESGRANWDKFKNKLIWLPTGCQAGEFGRQINDNATGESEAVLTKYDLGIKWGEESFGLTEMQKIVGAANDLLCRIR